MRINNNIMAMNTHRQYAVNNDNMAKATEKLSSGLRINRAGDDAAGLAISEKMRAQIRGLNMASKNSQDAISLVQTAEGALTETHSILQRMNELATQSASDTNQDDVDRDALQAEFTALRSEIDDIAEKTSFNGKKLLDGTFGTSVSIAAVNGTNIYAGDSDVTGITAEGFVAGSYSIGFALSGATGSDYTVT
jgi:flagellin